MLERVDSRPQRQRLCNLRTSLSRMRSEALNGQCAGDREKHHSELRRQEITLSQHSAPRATHFVCRAMGSFAPHCRSSSS